MDFAYRLEKANDYDYSNEPNSVTIARQRDQIQELNELIASLRTEVAQLKHAIKELEREDVERQRGRAYDWNNNVRAGGEYYE